MIPIVSIVGRSHSGKTTLLEKLIPLLGRRGYRVGIIKHHHQPDFEIDRSGKDTWRHYQAGAEAVLFAAPGKIALIERSGPTVPDLSELAARFPQVDIILTEGFKRGPAPKIEVIRAARSSTPVCPADELIAIVSDLELDLPVLRFALDDVEQVADFIEETFLRRTKQPV